MAHESNNFQKFASIKKVLKVFKSISIKKIKDQGKESSLYVSDENIPSDPSLWLPLVFLFQCGLNLSHTRIAVSFFLFSTLHQTFSFWRHVLIFFPIFYFLLIDSA